MTRIDLLHEIANTISDYRRGELAVPTATHVDRWVRQFSPENQNTILVEMDHLLKENYVSKLGVIEIFKCLIKSDAIPKGDPRLFWASANLLDLQPLGHSQSTICRIVKDLLYSEYGIVANGTISTSSVFVYFDDIIFSGNRCWTDLSKWIQNDAPTEARVIVCVIAFHRSAEWQYKAKLENFARQYGKSITIQFFGLPIENRLSYSQQSEVFWPVKVDDDPRVLTYAEEFVSNFRPRILQHTFSSKVFLSEEGRQIMESEFLLAGVKIRGFCQSASPIIRPLGYSSFNFGFGATIITYRNCPNNCPLALWWGDPEQEDWHPFSKWYPLLQRKTYERN